MANTVEFDGIEWVLVEGTPAFAQRGNTRMIGRAQATSIVQQCHAYVMDPKKESKHAYYEAKAAALAQLLAKNPED